MSISLYCHYRSKRIIRRCSRSKYKTCITWIMICVYTIKDKSGVVVRKYGVTIGKLKNLVIIMCNWSSKKKSIIRITFWKSTNTRKVLFIISYSQWPINIKCGLWVCCGNTYFFVFWFCYVSSCLVDDTFYELGTIKYPHRNVVVLSCEDSCESWGYWVDTVWESVVFIIWTWVCKSFEGHSSGTWITIHIGEVCIEPSSWLFSCWSICWVGDLCVCCDTLWEDEKWGESEDEREECLMYYCTREREREENQPLCGVSIQT